MSVSIVKTFFHYKYIHLRISNQTCSVQSSFFIWQKMWLEDVYCIWNVHWNVTWIQLNRMCLYKIKQPLMQCDKILLFSNITNEYIAYNFTFFLNSYLVILSFSIYNRRGFPEKRQHSCFVRVLIVLNIFFIIAIALSIAVIYRFAALIQESKWFFALNYFFELNIKFKYSWETHHKSIWINSQFFVQKKYLSWEKKFILFIVHE